MYMCIMYISSLIFRFQPYQPTKEYCLSQSVERGEYEQSDREMGIHWLLLSDGEITRECVPELSLFGQQQNYLYPLHMHLEN